MRCLAVLAGCFLSACSVAQNSVEIAGHRLCVPKGHVISKVAWIKPDGRAVRDSGGVAISNCLTVESATQALVKSKCLFLPEVGSVAIDNDSGFRTQINDPGFHDSLLGRVATGKDTSRTITEHRRILVTENQKIWSQWFVWHRKDAALMDESQPISDDDELVMTCGKSRSRLGAPRGEFRNFFKCERDFVAKGLFISYSFESESKVPSLDDVKKMDKSILDGVDKMKCN